MSRYILYLGMLIHQLTGCNFDFSILRSDFVAAPETQIQSDGINAHSSTNKGDNYDGPQ
ncbi:MAG: hypothetical protein ACLSGF_06320 [Alistipes onderdonkii]